MHKYEYVYELYRVDGALTLVAYVGEMACGFTKSCFLVVVSGFLTLSYSDVANSESGFHAQSRNLPATVDTSDRDCSRLTGAKNTPGARYIPDRKVVSADVEPIGSENFPVLRFGLELGKQRKNRYISPGMKNSRLRPGDLTIGEVIVDTYSGEVALDGQPLTRTGTRYGC